MKIVRLQALEILDSRGRPTLKTRCVLENGVEGSASVPSGASTGMAEALELRDGDLFRFGGLGCRNAVGHVNEIIHGALTGQSFPNQASFDTALIALDGTANKGRLGANALLSCSLAFARAMAMAKEQELYQYFGEIIGNDQFYLPMPTINLFSGGKHGGGQIPLQDLLVVPVSAKSMSSAMQMVYAVYQAAAKLIFEKYGMRALSADEGGLAPAFVKVEDVFEDAIASIEKSGWMPGKDIALALDVASSHFYENGYYYLNESGMSAQDFIEVLKSWVNQFPIISVEDGLAENDWVHWPKLKTAIQEKCLVLGDDLLCTQTARVQQAIDQNAANALLLKVNQCGTLTEAAEAFTLAKSAGWHVTVSARSGETEDDWLADLAVGWNGDHIKVGSITQSERLAKYNRLLELESWHGLTMKP